jgi:hypothetical protein
VTSRAGRPRRRLGPDPEAARRPPAPDQEASGPGSPDPPGEGIVTLALPLLREIARACLRGEDPLLRSMVDTPPAPTYEASR